MTSPAPASRRSTNSPTVMNMSFATRCRRSWTGTPSGSRRRRDRRSWACRTRAVRRLGQIALKMINRTDRIAFNGQLTELEMRFGTGGFSLFDETIEQLKGFVGTIRSQTSLCFREQRLFDFRRIPKRMISSEKKQQKQSTRHNPKPPMLSHAFIIACPPNEASGKPFATRARRYGAYLIVGIKRRPRDEYKIVFSTFFE